MERDQYFSQLMVRTQAGDQAAYNDLLRSVTDLVRGYLQKRMGLSSDLEDVLQDILISVHRARHTYQSDRPFGPWIYAIAKFRLCDYWRKSYRQMRHKEVEIESVDLQAPNRNLANTNGPDILEEVLNRLPKLQKDIVHLLKVQGRSIQDAARRLEMSEGAVKVAAHRAYKVLRREYEKETHENIGSH